MNAYDKLESTRCYCGRRKSSGKSFCFDCWCKLSSRIKNALYDPNGYSLTVDAAERFLANKGILPTV